ncbi:MAG: type II secretion system F family protein [Candidatus Omnitrophota bacterium]|nr:type II secretion system F family protein [Candidatus Omnitrophota bacterium]
MAIFSYRAKKGPKEVVTGMIEAGSEAAAIDKLEKTGYVPINVTPVKTGDSKKITVPTPESSRQFKGLSPAGRVRSKDLTIFTEQLAGLIRSKLPLLEAIDILLEQTENKALREIISHIQKDIKDGSTLSEGLSKYPRIFSTLYVNMVHSGEAGGVLEETLARLTDFRNREEELKAKVGSALAYPIFIIIVGAMTVFALLTFVIPRLSSLFSEMGQVLPLSTRILISISGQIKKYWHWGLTAMIAVVFILRRRGIRANEKIIFDRLKLKLPLLRDFIKKSILARFSRTLGILLANGIPVFQALEISIPTVDNGIFKIELEKVRKNVIDGISLEQGMRRSGFFPRFMTNMLAVGERGGNLQETLSEVADFYERQIDKTMKVMTSLLEPLIILIVGLVVGFIVLAMLMPIFQMNIQMG